MMNFLKNISTCAVGFVKCCPLPNRARALLYPFGFKNVVKKTA
jgi:hypothetical protein